MHRVLVDEDLPRTLAAFLRGRSIDAVDVRDASLRGAPDDAVFAFAQAERRTLVSGDLGFANVLRFPLGSHCGLVVVRCPNEVTAPSVNAAVAEALERVSDAEMFGALLIVEPSRVRMLRRSGDG